MYGPAPDLDAAARALGINEGSAATRGERKGLGRLPYLEDPFPPLLRATNLPIQRSPRVVY